MRKYTILQTIETGGPGGAETVFLNLVSNLNPRRFRSIALLPHGSWLPARLKERNIPTVIVESRAWYDPTLLRAMARVIRQERVDLIHSHLPDQNFYGCLAGRLTHRRTIVTYHGAPQASRNYGIAQVLKLWFVRHSAAAVVVVSDYLKCWLKDARFPINRVERIYNGVNVDRFSGSGSRRLHEEFGWPDTIKIVGMVANLRHAKGYEHFVRAAREVNDCIPQTRFVAIGEVDEQIGRSLSTLIRQLGLEDRFFLLGFRSDVPEILNDLDVFVLSSSSEGLSIATIEAMAASRPVVVTRSGGPEEIVEDGSTGFLVPPADPASLATRISQLILDPELALRLGKNARAAVEHKFSLAGMIKEYESLYERCLAFS